MRYHLIVDAELKREMDAGYAAWKQDPSSDAGKEFMAAIDAMKALREGRESHYQGKQLGYGPGSHDLRDVAELKVPVFDEYKSNGWPLGPSHRLTYREFDPLPRVEIGWSRMPMPSPIGRWWRSFIVRMIPPRSPANVSDGSAGCRSESCTG